LAFAGLAAASGEQAASTNAATTVKAVLESVQFRQASAFVDGDYDRFVRELIALNEIPAPPFREQARAKAFLEMLRKEGLSDVEMDAEGNAMGVRKGTATGQMVAVLAHLDTVFPEGTDVKVKRQGTRLMAPGISDNTRGAAVMLAVVRAMNAGKFRTPADVLFVGNVGEEGEGDLRGAKFVMQKGKYKDRIKQFIAIDATEQNVVTRQGVGSLRYRVAFSGPGGHSYTAFGLVNPAFAMGSAIAKIATLQAPASPKTTFNVGVVSGGTSINSIPVRVQMDVDLRSESCAELKKIDASFQAMVTQAVDEENAARSTKEGGIVADLKLIGDRPCGETPVASPLVRLASSVVSAFGLKPAHPTASTDANVAMSLGIPAITIGRGGPGGRTHSLDEWTDVERNSALQAIRIAMVTIVAAANTK
jgi:acetylornithine deacetylase/succinyl-diaminopimelate desuccinylase-like protein